MEINYSAHVLSLPLDPVFRVMQTATAEQFRVMIYLCSNDEFRNDPSKNRARAVKDLHMQWADIEEAISFWDKNGAFLDSENINKPVIEKKSKSSELLKREAPEYSSEEAANIIEKSDELKRLIDKCSVFLGKMLNKNEVSHIVSMYEYLRLSPEYIDKLFEHCTDNDKKSVVYISRMAYSMFDNDIITTEALEAHLEEEDKKNNLLYRIKELFGIGVRALTSKEKNNFTRWIEEYKMPFEMIKEAYEITVDRTGESAVSYASAILKRWHTAGFTTVEETKAEAESYKASQKEKEAKNKNQLGDFDEDEFMTAAIKRSYKDKKQ